MERQILSNTAFTLNNLATIVNSMDTNRIDAVNEKTNRNKVLINALEDETDKYPDARSCIISLACDIGKEIL